MNRMLFFLLLLLMACSDPETQINNLITQEGDAVKSKLELIKGIGNLDKESPLLEKGFVDKEKLKRFKLFKNIKLSANAEVLFQEQFEDLEKSLIFEVSGTGKEARVMQETMDAYRVSAKRNVVNLAASLYQKRAYPDDSKKKPEPQDFRHVFSAVQQLKYLVVIRQVVRKEPELIQAQNSFEPGVFIGYISIYDIEEQERVAAFGFQASNSEKISSYTVNNQSLSYYHLIKDFAKNIQKSFKKALRQHKLIK